jgi:protein TonB
MKTERLKRCVAVCVSLARVPLPSLRRAMIVAVSILVHGAVFVLLGAATPSATFDRPITIEVVSQGEGLVDTAAATPAAEPLPRVIVDDRAPPAAETADTPVPNVAQISVEPPSVPTPPISSDAADAREPPSQTASFTPPQPRRHATPEKPARTARRSPRRMLVNAAASQGNDSIAADARRAGAPTAQAGDARAVRVSYGALISAELNRHKFYPAAARERGERGSVGAVFTVGSSGSIVSHAITRSSGSAALDDVVHAMMAAAQGLPPPGGSFHGAIVVNFNLR